MATDKPAAERHTESSIFARIKAKHASGYAVIRGVRNAASFDADRTCDALVMGTWKSNGLHLHGFEIKVSRNDWLREIQDPSKAEAFAKHCHYWWIAAAPGVVKLEELPAMWGLMEAAGETLKVRRPATFRDPDRLEWSMLAALLRRSTEQSVDADLLQASYDKGVEAGKVIGLAEADGSRRVLKELSDAVQKFERESGVKIDRWSCGDVGKAVRFVVNALGSADALKYAIKGIRGSAANLERASVAALDELRALTGTPPSDVAPEVDDDEAAA